MDTAIFLPIVSLTKAGSDLIVTARGKVDSYVDDSEYRRAVADMSGGDASDRPLVKRVNGLLEITAKVFSASVIEKLITAIYKGYRLGLSGSRISSLAFWDSPYALSKSVDSLGLLFKREICDCNMCTREENKMKKDAAARHPGSGKYVSTTSESQKEAERMISAADLAALIDEVLAESLNDFDGHATPAEVLSRARAAAQRTLRRAGFDVDDRVTGGENDDPSLQPERSQKDLRGKPERPAQPEQKMMDCSDLFKALGVIGSDGIGSRETILLNKAQQLVAEARMSLEAERMAQSQNDNGMLDRVLKSRITDSRQAVAGSSSALLKGNRERINTLFRGNVLQRTDAISKSDGGAATDDGDTIAKSMTAVAAAQERGAVPLSEMLSDARGRPQVRAGYVFDIAGRAVADPVEELAERLAKSAATRRSGKGSAGLLH